MYTNRLSLTTFSYPFFNHNPTRTHIASPKHIWEDDRMEMGRWRGLVSRETSGERNGYGEVTSEHHQPHLPHLTANQGPPPPQLVFPPLHIGLFYPTTSPTTIHLWKPSNEGSVLVLAQPPPPPPCAA